MSQPPFSHRIIRPSILYVGTPVALITTLNPDGTPNISPMSSAWALGDRMMLGLSTASMGYANVKRAGELVINFPEARYWTSVEAIARTTGRSPVPLDKQAVGYVHDADKFATAGLTPQPAMAVEPPRVAECALQMEARLIADHPIGDSGMARALETQVLLVHAANNIIIPRTEHIDTALWSPLLYVFRHYFSTGNRLGRTFKAEV